MLGTVALGLFFGMVAGYFGGKVDLVITQVLNVLLSLPSLLLSLAILGVLGPGTIEPAARADRRGLGRARPDLPGGGAGPPGAGLRRSRRQHRRQPGRGSSGAISSPISSRRSPCWPRSISAS